MISEAESSSSTDSFKINIDEKHPLILGYSDYNDATNFVGTKYFDLVLGIDSQDEVFNLFKQLVYVVSNWWNNYQRYISNPYISWDQISTKYKEFINEIISTTPKAYHKQIIPLIVKIARNTQIYDTIIQGLDDHIKEMIGLYQNEEALLDIKRCEYLFSYEIK